MQINKRYLVAGLIAVIVIVLFFVIIHTFYHSNPRMPEAKVTDRQSKVEDNLKRVNKFLAEKDQERIRSFLERRGWQMQTLGSGLWYMVYSHGQGDDIDQGMYVKMNYEIRLLDGTLCYTSDSTGAKVFRVGDDDEPQGLHQAVEKLRVGDRARIIIPPHLAHGLVGDGERIPARAILLYDVYLMDASRQKIRR